MNELTHTVYIYVFTDTIACLPEPSKIQRRKASYTTKILNTLLADTAEN